MRDALAISRYLQRHAEPGLPRAEAGNARWRHVLVLPAFRESPTLLRRLARLGGPGEALLVVLVLNRPDGRSGPDDNSALRGAVNALPAAPAAGAARLFAVGEHAALLLLDLDALAGPLPADLGVGLARKCGCDLALQWIDAGLVDSDWICCSDADAQLPDTYPGQLSTAAADAVAATFPFRHVAAQAADIAAATALYELRLHHYVLGLEYAASPWAWHSMGSCLAVRAAAYAHCRGFPRRAGAEDFYLLSKLAKLGPVARLGGDCIGIDARLSDRVPFGTGPAVAALLSPPGAQQPALFYHPATFTALRAVLDCVEPLVTEAGAEPGRLLADHGLAAELCAPAATALQALGMEKALLNCRRHRDPAGFTRHFHQWFDAFRTLKFLHLLRDAGWPMLPLSELAQETPWLWPGPADGDTQPGVLRQRVAAHWGWR
ncbi:MAG: hypothetical protein CME59_03790 [Halioglobus sp.]|nr:hypothetical protein [Halioglobus sp.]